jgi:rhodanese-related sulfurtransferase
MDPRSVHERRDDVQIVDVREDEEWAAGRIDGARHVPLAQLPSRLGELDRDRPVVTVCRSGNRSGQAAAYLRQAGLSAHNMDGGMKRWARDGLPFSTPDGRPGRVG